MKHLLPSFLRTLVAVMIAVAICVQFIHGLLLTTEPVWIYIEQFFGYFTILSNIFLAVIFVRLARGIMHKTTFSAHFDSIRGAAIFCILATGIIYTFFLRGPGVGDAMPNSIPLINAIFHYIVPTIGVLDWIVFPPKHRINWSTLFSWIGITIIYLGLVEFAGLFTKKYPYFFLDPVRLHGYTGVLFASAAFLPFFLVFALFVIGSVNFQRRFRHY